MKGHGNLNQSLKELLVLGRRSTPDVLEGLVSVEKLCLVEQANSPQILVGIHTSFWHRLGATRDKGGFKQKTSRRSARFEKARLDAYRPNIT